MVSVQLVLIITFSRILCALQIARTENMEKSPLILAILATRLVRYASEEPLPNVMPVQMAICFIIKAAFQTARAARVCGQT